MEESKILDRVKKLLALSQSANEHEATAAAERAQELLTRHKLDMAQVTALADEQDDPVTHCSVKAGLHGHPTRWAYILSDGVARACFCKAICTPSLREIQFIGRRSDTEVAADLFCWLQTQLLAALARSRDARPRRVHWLTWRTSFLVGAASRVRDRLIESVRKQEQEIGERVTALVRATDAENARYIETTWGKLGRADSVGTGDLHGFFTGAAAGDSVALGVEKRLGGLKALPGS